MISIFFQFYHKIFFLFRSKVFYFCLLYFWFCLLCKVRFPWQRVQDQHCRCHQGCPPVLLIWGHTRSRISCCRRHVIADAFTDIQLEHNMTRPNEDPLENAPDIFCYVYVLRTHLFSRFWFVALQSSSNFCSSQNFADTRSGRCWAAQRDLGESSRVCWLPSTFWSILQLRSTRTKGL